MDVGKLPLILSEKFFQYLADGLRLVGPTIQWFANVGDAVLHGDLSCSPALYTGVKRSRFY